MKHAEVLMSTYNGEKYIARQIETILNQEDVIIHITIRDDGSSDSSFDIIQKIASKFPQSITLYKGDNLGYKKSFLKLLELASDADYYAFSDQDDVWDSKKIIRAINCLENKNRISLYAGSVYIANEDMSIVGYNDISNTTHSIQSYFIRARIPGCTFVFTKGLKTLVSRLSNIDYPKDIMPGHDFIIGACAIEFGDVFFDQKSFIYHVRYNNSITSRGFGLWNRIQSELKVTFKIKHNKRTAADILLQYYSQELSTSTKKYLIDLSNYNKSFTNKIKFLFKYRTRSGYIFFDLEQKIKILLGNY